MPLSPGARLGPYEVLSPLGAGGMGEVYRAKDQRLGREVAVKVLPPGYSSDPDRLRRFEQEAKAAGALNHPNLLAVFDAGQHEGNPYVAFELLDGVTLRQRLGPGPLPVRKALDYAVQIAQGLAAAHEKGIVHRDLKPENLFVTKDDRVKILDFGLAKLSRPSEVFKKLNTSAETMSSPTNPGTVLGTLGYMSPEQVQGVPAGPTADIFSFGAVLYEMLSGQRAFRGATAVETMNAILKEDPPELQDPSGRIPPVLERIVRRCLEKRPEHRFHSAHDLGLALEAVSGGASLSSPAITAPTAPRRRWRSVFAAGLGLLALLATFLAGERASERALPSYRRITFRHGTVGTARFSSDGQTILYGAHWGADPWALFSIRLGSTEARPLGFPGAEVVATYGSEMAVLLGNGTLARVPMDGGTPRDILEGVDSADWTRDGTRFAVVRNVGDQQRLECPIGKVVFETTGAQRIARPRLSPSSDLVAFLDMPTGAIDYFGDIAVVDLSGQKRVLSKAWTATSGLAWSLDGREVWFTGTKAGFAQALYAVTLSGQERLVTRVAGSLNLKDIAPDGRVLLTQEQRRWETRGRMAGDAAERDLSWLDGTLIPVLSPDGTRMVFQEWGEGGSAVGSTYLRKLDGSPAVRLADGTPMSVSPDWKWVLCGVSFPTQELRLVPIGAGEAKTLPRGSVSAYRWASWHPDGKRIVFQASEAGRPNRVFVQELPAGLPHPISPEGVNPTLWVNLAISPDGVSTPLVRRAHDPPTSSIRSTEVNPVQSRAWRSMMSPSSGVMMVVRCSCRLV